MSVTINPRSQGGQLGERLAARASVASTPGPRTGYAWGLLVTRMEERVLLPGEAAKTKLVWGRCRNAPRCGSPDCIEAGKCLAGGTTVLPCSRCWDTNKIDANLTIHGPLDAPLGISCERCKGRDSEVQADTGIPPGYTEAMARIAEWNATIDRRIERRETVDWECGSCGHKASDHDSKGCSKCNCRLARR